jgi:hypothetical protein
VLQVDNLFRSGCGRSKEKSAFDDTDHAPHAGGCARTPSGCTP